MKMRVNTMLGASCEGFLSLTIYNKVGKWFKAVQ